MILYQDNLTALRRMESGSVQLVVTSPPYNVGKEYEARLALDEYVARHTPVIEECARVLRPGGSICWQVGNHVDNGSVVPLDVIFFPILQAQGLTPRNRIVWAFGHGLHCKKRLSGRHETILWFTKGDEYLFDLDPIRVPSKYPNKRHFKGPNKGKLSGNPLGKNPSDVWEIPNVKANHPEKTVHPCQFPIELAERLVLAMSAPNDVVLDPYAGVGSAVIAAAKHGRRGVGLEINPHYCVVAKQRLEQLAAGSLPYRPMSRPIYQPPESEREFE